LERRRPICLKGEDKTALREAEASRLGILTGGGRRQGKKVKTFGGVPKEIERLKEEMQKRENTEEIIEPGKITEARKHVKEDSAFCGRRKNYPNQKPNPYARGKAHSPLHGYP